MSGVANMANVTKVECPDGNLVLAQCAERCRLRRVGCSGCLPANGSWRGGNESVRSIELKPLIGRLNEVSRRALEGAAGLTALRTHYNVEIEHILIGLL